MRQRQQAKNATINRELAALKRMFHLGMKATLAKVLRIAAFPHLAENNIRKGFPEDGQYLKITDDCPELWFRSIVDCGRTYGRRISELLTMRVSQVDLSPRVIRLEPGTIKNREDREVVMTDTVHTLLSACVDGKVATDYVIHTQQWEARSRFP
jgi:integrase